MGRLRSRTSACSASIEQFVAVLNPPQAAILAAGATEERAIVTDGEIGIKPMMTMTLTVDYRAVDHAVGSDFLRIAEGASSSKTCLRFNWEARRMKPSGCARQRCCVCPG